MQNILFDFR